MACIAGIEMHKKMLAVLIRQQSGAQIDYVHGIGLGGPFQAAPDASVDDAGGAGAQADFRDVPRLPDRWGSGDPEESSIP
jgi:hypothetical protein